MLLLLYVSGPLGLRFINFKKINTIATVNVFGYIVWLQKQEHLVMLQFIVRKTWHGGKLSPPPHRHRLSSSGVSREAGVGPLLESSRLPSSSGGAFASAHSFQSHKPGCSVFPLPPASSSRGSQTLASLDLLPGSWVLRVRTHFSGAFGPKTTTTFKKPEWHHGNPGIQRGNLSQQRSTPN